MSTSFCEFSPTEQLPGANAEALLYNEICKNLMDAYPDYFIFRLLYNQALQVISFNKLVTILQIADT